MSCGLSNAPAKQREWRFHVLTHGFQTRATFPSHTSRHRSTAPGGDRFHEKPSEPIIRTVIFTLAATLLLGIGTVTAVVYAGVYDVAATDPHWSATTWLLETARVRSIKAHATGLAVPAGFDEQGNVVSAVGHFAAHCAVCHGAPGVDQSEFVQGMYPQPPDLTEVNKRYTPAELFWILKHGIKMSGMPSMADDGDDLLWATVGFLEKLPGITPDGYNDLWMASQAQDGGHHQHMMDMGDMHMHGGVMDGAPGHADGKKDQ